MSSMPCPIRGLSSFMMLLIFAATLFLSNCTNTTQGPVIGSQKPPETPSDTRRSKITRLYSNVFVRTAGQSTGQTLGEGEGEVHNGDSVSTDENGEAVV